MTKGKKKQTSSSRGSDQADSAPAEVIPMDIFRAGMNFENTIEYIESKTLDAFFGHICRQGDWDLAKQHIAHVKEWCQMLRVEFNFLPEDIQKKILKASDALESATDELLGTIDEKDFDEANKKLEKILKVIRGLYKLRE